MNIDPFQLFPKHLEDFKYNNNGNELDKDESKLRLAHNNKKR